MKWIRHSTLIEWNESEKCRYFRTKEHSQSVCLIYVLLSCGKFMPHLFLNVQVHFMCFMKMYSALTMTWKCTQTVDLWICLFKRETHTHTHNTPFHSFLFRIWSYFLVKLKWQHVPTYKHTNLDKMLICHKMSSARKRRDHSFRIRMEAKCRIKCFSPWFISWEFYKCTPSLVYIGVNWWQCCWWNRRFYTMKKKTLKPKQIKYDSFLFAYRMNVSNCARIQHQNLYVVLTCYVVCTHAPARQNIRI